MDYSILRQSKELSKVELYKMVISDTNICLGTDSEGVIINSDAWVLYQTKDPTGKDIEVLSILDEEAGVYCTISETFKRHFFEIVDCFGDDMSPIKVIYGTSRNGRKFVSCTLA